MITIKEDLKSIYNQFKPEADSKPVDEDFQMRVIHAVLEATSKNLLSAGDESNEITRNYRKLSLICHPDKHSEFSTEMQWLEKVIGNGEVFKILTSVYVRLTKPQDEADEKFEYAEFTGLDDFVKYYEYKYNNAENLYEKYIAKQMLNLLTNLKDSDEILSDRFNLDKTNCCFQLGSFLHSGYLTLIFMPEIIVCYGLGTIIKYLGKDLEHSKFSAFNIIGKSALTLGRTLNFAAASTVIQIYNMHLSTVTLPYHAGTSITKHSSDLLNYVSRLMHKNKNPYSCNTLILHQQHNSVTLDDFSSETLKQIIKPLLEYIDSCQQQYIKALRASNQKSKILLSALINIRTIDKQFENLSDKLIAIQKLFQALRQDKVIASGTKKNALCAVTHANYLLKNELVKLQEMSKDQKRIPSPCK